MANRKFPYIYDQDTKNDDQKFPYIYGPHTKTDDLKFPYIYALATKTGEVKLPYIYGPTMGTNGKNYKFPYIYGLERNVDDQKTTRSKGFPGISTMGASNLQEKVSEGDVHIHGDFTFTEDIVKLGSTIIPYILPSATLGAPLLQRDIADSIPISMRNFNGIMKMFASVSYTMANDIWSTLNMCENVHPLNGEKKTCIGSVESMVEFVSSMLGSTRDLQAFSSSQVPNEGVVTRRRYKVVAS
ncbi:BURP domain-containing protein 10-like [Aegilops tauschii subsp. strangulata]|uniref:BURP domain-containing protein 10-like n=1 Tax=Aegilops tauschii subsp. strangulata TaxID=200361 RepID=UPI001ABCD89D|nr:BURP domain-containing protein 10-like [Aegilops tauschii subsp. strangulata]